MPILKSMTRVIRVLLPAAAVVSVAGCSADVARFDSAGFTGSQTQTNSIPIPPASVYSPAPRAGLLGEGDGASHQPMADASPRGGDVRVAELPPTTNNYDGGRGYNERGYSAGNRSYQGDGYQAPEAPSYDRGKAAGYDSVSAKPYDAAPRARQTAAARMDTAAHSQAGDQTIEVKQGDTLYSLSRQHGVKVDDIMSANDLKGHSLKPGQRLTLPSSQVASRADPVSGAVTPPPAAVAPVAEAAPAEAAAASDTAGTYTMKAGDSLYTIARQHKVNYAELQRANGITDDNVRKIRPGTVLKIPAGSAPQATRASTTVSLSKTGTHLPVSGDAPTAASDLPKTDTTAAAADAPKVLNSAPEMPPATTGGAEQATAAAPTGPEQKVAALDTKSANDATPVQESKAADDKSAAGSGRLRWPVQGRIISTFGPRPDGTHNDGVNFSVPQGTDVHAAENGEVIYVGDELKAYGKLVLLRHDNGWVTAYAHNEDLLVTRGKKVARGDVIAKAGKTGPVDQPQVHFELRQDSKAVDPTSFMEKQ